MNNLIINTKRPDLPLYFNALDFAAYKHRFQKRKGAKGIPYINHPIAVANLILSSIRDPSPDLVIAAILHDTLEDTDTTTEEIESAYGKKVLEIVQEVSDDMKLPSRKRKQLQVDHAASLSPEARAIKIADKTCNIRDVLITPYLWPRKQKIYYVNWTIQVIRQICDSHPPLKEEFEKIVRRAEEKLNTKFDLTIA